MADWGITSAEAARRLAERPPPDTSGARTVKQIVRENTFTLFNLILVAFAVAMAAVQLWADLLFLGVLLVNTGIGIVQELRAKRTLEQLALLVAPRARVLRDGEERSIAVDEVVEGDAVRLDAGDQVVADGPLVEARGLQFDESVLTGESDPVARRPGEQVRSGSYALAGGGIYLAERVGEDSYAAQVAGEAQAVRDVRSPLQHDIDRLLKVTVAVMIPLAIVLIVALRYHEKELRESVATAAAGIITLVPEGLVLLTSIAFAVAAARMARRGALVQRLNAVESLAGVDVVCVDKTGTLTDGTLALEEVVPLNGLAPDEALARVGVFAASLAGRNPTADAIANETGAHERPVAAEVPFSSRWKWSGIRWNDGSGEVLGAPEALEAAASLPQSTREAIAHEAGQQRRVLLFAEARHRSQNRTRTRSPRRRDYGPSRSSCCASGCAARRLPRWRTSRARASRSRSYRATARLPSRPSRAPPGSTPGAASSPGPSCPPAGPSSRRRPSTTWCSRACSPTRSACWSRRCDRAAGAWP